MIKISKKKGERGSSKNKEERKVIDKNVVRQICAAFSTFIRGGEESPSLRVDCCTLTGCDVIEFKHLQKKEKKV